ncbi:rhodanese-like domain-containing protein [bacterium]|nr:rhodanese-like domain-containing protein [bacterium]
MAAYSTIDGRQAWRDVGLGALLINGFEDAEGWYRSQVAGSMSFVDFQQQLDDLSPDKELIFYCDCDDDGKAIEQAEKFARQGYTNVRVVEGGRNALEQNRPQQAGAARG